MRDKAEQIAKIIINGFRRHYSLFMQTTAQAKEQFEQGQWVRVKENRTERISYYKNRVSETVHLIQKKYSATKPEDALWKKVKATYKEYLMFHPQAELAETYYNSVFCKLFSWPYYHNDYIFVHSTLNRHYLPNSVHSVYTRYFPSQYGIRNTLKTIFKSFHFTIPFDNMNRDIRLLVRHAIRTSQQTRYPLHKIFIDIVDSVFYRNKAAYIVGRVVTPITQQPFVIVLLQKNHKIFIDTLITDKKTIDILFGFYRAYFMVETQNPSALIYFLQELMPNKDLADLYSIIGLHKQGKTEFYRKLLDYLGKNKQTFVEAPGIAGMVMFVFTLPDFPYVFKIIRDTFDRNKECSHELVKSRYYLVKKHDRVGRMADIFEYSNVALPLNHFTPELLSSMEQKLKKTVYIEQDQLIIKHLFIERRMTPLNLYLDQADKKEQEQLIQDYGQAIKDMMSVNIFPGDMLFKNFGVTLYKRVVFYDYDEVNYLDQMNFRTIPEAQTYEQEMARDPWYSVSPNDFFPEEILTCVTTNSFFRDCLKKHHPDLLEASYWQEKQQNIRDGGMEDIFPYPVSTRFEILYSDEY